MRSIRLPLALAALLAALLTTVNVSAFKQATVTNSSTFAVVSTDNAALALAGVSSQAWVQGNMLQIDFSRGYGGAVLQFQTDDNTNPALAEEVVETRQVFSITNNSADCYDVRVSLGGPVTNLTGIWARNSLGSLIQVTNSAGTSLQPVKMGNGFNTTTVDFRWTAATPTSSGSFTVFVSGQRSTCP